jgi:eukaryotic-like serine/threonine-protein kinase
MVTKVGHAKILDFGLAMERDEEPPEDRKILGGQGYVVGTMDFIAPEQISDSAGVDHRADLYSLGCTLYFVLTGQPPFPGGSSKRKMKRHLQESPEPVQEINPDVPDGFARIVERLMEKDPERRYPNADAVCEAIMPWSRDDDPLPADEVLTNAQIIDEATTAKQHQWREVGTTLAAVAPSESSSLHSLTLPPAEPKKSRSGDPVRDLVRQQRLAVILLGTSVLLLALTIFIFLMTRKSAIE